jgi:hypothetical protein
MHHGRVRRCYGTYADEHFESDERTKMAIAAAALVEHVLMLAPSAPFSDSRHSPLVSEQALQLWRW